MLPRDNRTNSDQNPAKIRKPAALERFMRQALSLTKNASAFLPLHSSGLSLLYGFGGQKYLLQHNTPNFRI